MNRRNFLKSFTAAVAGTVVALQMPLSTPLSERVVVAKEQYSLLTDVYEIKIDPFNTMRVMKFQYLLRQKELEAKGYTLNGNQIVYAPKYDFYEEEWDSE